MSAVMKEVKELPEEQPKSLTELCVVNDTLPDDFYKNTAAYKKQLDDTLAVAKSLVHEIDDDGKKKAKADVALIRKLTGNTNKFSLSVFRTLTDKVKLWKDDITVKTKALNDEADCIMSRFEEHEKAKLANIKALVIADLNEQRTALSIRCEFINPNADISSVIKLSGTLTPKGLLTTKAIGFITAIANGELAAQQQHDNRVLVLKVKCLEAEINPPLPPSYLGSAFHGTDEEFNAKLDELIAAEMVRRAETIARVERENKAANQKKIDDALVAQQAEANRIANEKLEAERQSDFDKQAAINHERANKVVEQEALDKETQKTETTPEELRASAARIAESAERANSNADRRKELSQSQAIYKQADELEKATTPAKRTVRVTAVFEFENISSRVSNTGVESFFRGQLSEKLQAIAKEISAKNG
ncbi:MAG: hypothetical protein WC856_02160 [Methylococcaceae bacterium]|jgi:hypothetical protein